MVKEGLSVPQRLVKWLDLGWGRTLVGGTDEGRDNAIARERNF